MDAIDEALKTKMKDHLSQHTIRLMQTEGVKKRHNDEWNLEIKRDREWINALAESLKLGCTDPMFDILGPEEANAFLGVQGELEFG